MSHPATRWILLLLLFPIFNSIAQVKQAIDYTSHVDPFIGTGGHGHTFPGATVPFGMVQLSPDTRDDGSWDGCSGYHHSDSLLFGFTHTHLSGTGCSDYGDILLMPVNDTVSMKRKYSASFKHENEKASAGYYSVKMDNGISAELSSTTRCGIHRYTYPITNPAVLLDLVHRDKVLDGFLKVVDKTTVEGYRRSNAWAKDQVVYFRIEFAKPWLDFRMVSDSMKKDNIRFRNEYYGKIKALFRFDLRPGEPLIAKVSISGVDAEGAQKNMLQEMPGWDFEKIKTDAKAAWNQELGKIDVSGGTAEQMKIFYTALYHCFIQPNIYSDVDGRYRGRDLKIHKAEGFNYYTVFSLWDTFRAWHPLITIIDRKRTLDFIKTFLAEYEQGGLLPVWELSSNETECMIGYHSVSVLADAAAKGISGFDMNKALEAMKKSAEARDRFGLGSYIDKGMIETDDEAENASRTLEYAYDDWCIARMAAMLSKQDDVKRYSERAQSWKNLFDPEKGFIRPRKNGGWYEPFEPREVNINYTEANAWQYNFFVPHDVNTFIQLYGGPEKFEKKLDELFSTESQTTGREQADISGLIGQYAHGNEPSHHMAFLYHYVNKPWKTQTRVNQILGNFYHGAPDGLIGNEDCGQMSAWYVLNALGMYQVCPGNPDYEWFLPLFPKYTIYLENQKTFSVSLDKNPYEYMTGEFFQGFRQQGKEFFGEKLPYGKIMNGGAYAFKYKKAGKGDAATSTVAKTDYSASIIRNPVIVAESVSFKTSMAVSINSSDGKAYFTTDGSEPGTKSSVYNASAPVMVNNSTTIKAIAINDKGEKSKVVTARFFKMPHPDWKIQLNSTYNNQYTAGGNDALIDGMRGDANWKKGYWQGYEGQDFECTIDLGAVANVTSLSAGFLQDAGAWIMMPKKLEASFSEDGKNFTATGSVAGNVSDKEEKVQVKEYRITLPKPVAARYVKVKVTGYGFLSSWHPGAGGKSWVFVDEIVVE